ncbi:unnamed protein product [Closterium sp. NIES-64]|nr:unnamed protein product [Closterium sp. NIES-64]
MRAASLAFPGRLRTFALHSLIPQCRSFVLIILLPTPPHTLPQATLHLLGVELDARRPYPFQKSSPWIFLFLLTHPPPSPTLPPPVPPQAALHSLGVELDARRPYPILHGCSGVLRPGRMTLLLGPPSVGKSTLLQALAGCLDKSLKVSGSVTYNGHALNEFVPECTAVYVPQNDEHIGEMTVRETLDFSARLQGPGLRKRPGAAQRCACANVGKGKNGGLLDGWVALGFGLHSPSPSTPPSPQHSPFSIPFTPAPPGGAELVAELERREAEKGIVPDPTMDPIMKVRCYDGTMKAMALEGNPTNIITDYVLKILGLDICADTVVGNNMLRGISGGQKKRVTTGVSLVGGQQVLLMDEISTGLDSSTTFLITRCLRHPTHLHATTTLVALLQPALETYHLFDDVLFLAEGHVVFHGPREDVLPFFSRLGLECPARKGEADFLQEMTSMKDQGQYWRGGAVGADGGAGGKSQPYHYVPVQAFEAAFKETEIGKATAAHLSVRTHC